MAAPPIPSALDARTQIFPTLTPSQIDRIRPQGHVRHVDASLPGVFAVGDVRSGNVKRVASAVGEGAIAIHLVHRALAEL